MTSTHTPLLEASLRFAGCSGYMKKTTRYVRGGYSSPEVKYKRSVQGDAEVEVEEKGGGGVCESHVMRGGSRMTVDPRIPTMPWTEHVGFSLSPTRQTVLRLPQTRMETRGVGRVVWRVSCILLRTSY